MSNKPVAAGKSSFDLVDTEKVFAIVAPKPGSYFLDLACGVGKYSIEIGKIIGSKGMVYSIDLWPEGIDFLNEKANSQNLKNIKTILADVTKDLPLCDNKIDACLIATVLHDLTKLERESVLKEVARLLKSEGILNVIEFKKIEKGPGPPIDIRISEKEIDELVVPYGFEKISLNEVGDYNYLIQYKKST